MTSQIGTIPVSRLHTLGISASLQEGNQNPAEHLRNATREDNLFGNVLDFVEVDLDHSTGGSQAPKTLNIWP
jgi:hypothetical protein